MILDQLCQIEIVPNLQLFFFFADFSGMHDPPLVPESIKKKIFFMQGTQTSSFTTKKVMLLLKICLVLKKQREEEVDRVKVPPPPPPILKCVYLSRYLSFTTKGGGRGAGGGSFSPSSPSPLLKSKNVCIFVPFCRKCRQCALCCTPFPCIVRLCLSTRLSSAHIGNSKCQILCRTSRPCPFLSCL